MKNTKQKNKNRVKEELIVLRCCLGESGAFRELTERWEKRLLYYIMRFIKNEQDAYDVLQEVWMTVFRKIRELNDVNAFRTWLYRIAHCKAVSRVRSEYSRRRLREELKAEVGVEERNDSPIGQKIDAHSIHGLLEQLSAPHREVIVLFFFEGMKYREIAEVSGCGIGVVRSRLHYAKSRLRELLEKQKNESFQP